MRIFRIRSFAIHAAEELTAPSLAVVATSLTLLSGVATAQERTEAGVLDEIVVTAQKRSENIQDVPISMTAFGEQEIEDKQIADIDDIANLLPSIQFSNHSKGAPRPQIRNFGSTDGGPGYDEPVGLFVDGVYFARGAEFGDTQFDIERIEVLYGPQGTLFGKNVTAGAFSISTLQPTNERRIKLAATYGNYNLRRLDAHISGPLIENKLLGKIAGTRVLRDGYATNLNDGSELDDRDRLSGRAQLVWLPDDRWRISLTAFAAKIDEEPIPIYHFGDPITLPGILATSEGDAYMPPGDFYEKSSSGAYLDIEYAMPWATFRSITAHHGYDLSQQNGGQHGTNHAVLDGYNGERDGAYGETDSEQLTQEFQLISPSDREFTWVGGVFYQDLEETEHLRYALNIPCEGGPFDPTLIALGVFAPNPNAGAGCFLNTIFGYPSLPADVIDTQTIKTESWAAFGQATWEFVQDWRLTLGGRYSDDKKSGITSVSGTPNFVSLSVPGGSFTSPLLLEEDAFTPKAVLDWKPVEDIMFYVSAARGYKSGGFAFLIPNPESAAPFKSEYVWNYELGMKGDFLDNRLRLNTTIYRSDFKNRQGTFLEPDVGNLAPFNYPYWDMRGAELEGQAYLTDNLRVNLTYAYSEGEFGAVDVHEDGTIDIPAGELSGNSKNSFSGGFDYTFPNEIFGGALRVGANGSFSSSQTYLGDPTLETGSIQMIDARIVYSVGNFELMFWSKNLNDEQVQMPVAFDASVFFRNFQEFLDGPNQRKTYWNTYRDPRTYGLTLTWQPE